MKKTIYMALILTGIIGMSITMTACSNPEKAENIDINQEVSQVVQENLQLKEEILQLQQKNQELDEEITKLDPNRPQKDKGTDVKETESIFAIYGANVDTYDRELLKEISLKDSQTIDDKLQIIAETIAKEKFGGLGIQLSKIESEDGKNVAIINLTENATKKDVSWHTNFFQGSTGGTVTTVSLQETFLQRDYEGEWIDGVRFLYEDEKIEFDHVESLGKVMDRK